MTVNAQNDETTLVADSTTTNEDAAVTLNVLTNDTDLDNDGSNATLVSASLLYTSAAADDLPSGDLTYRRNANYKGPDQCT